MSNYTLDDIEIFISDYSKDCPKPADWMINIPVVGKMMYQKAALEQHKRELFKRKYLEVLESDTIEQAKFIEGMTPVLDDFYSNKVNKKTINKKH